MSVFSYFHRKFAKNLNHCMCTMEKPGSKSHDFSNGHPSHRTADHNVFLLQNGGL